MDDAANLALMILFGVLGIFILVRIVKHASRTVDQEQKDRNGCVQAEYPLLHVAHSAPNAASKTARCQSFVADAGIYSLPRRRAFRGRRPPMHHLTPQFCHRLQPTSQGR